MAQRPRNHAEEKKAHRCPGYLNSTPHNLRSVPSTVGRKFLVLPSRCCRTEREVEESGALRFGAGTGFEGVRGKELDAANPMGGEDMVTSWSGVLVICALGVLAKLLSTDWLRERHLDTLSLYLNFRVSEDGKGRTGCWVGDVYLSTCLKKVYRVTRTTIHTDWDLNRYRDEITTCGFKRLFFPANLNNNHWATFGVNLEKKEFCYGAPSCFAPLGSLTRCHFIQSRRLAW